MAKKQIIWSKRANTELVEVLQYYFERNGNSRYSLKILLEVEALLNLLSESPNIGRLTTDQKSRVITMKVYLIFYEINENRIEVLSFWDNRQDQSKRIDFKE